MSPCPSTTFNLVGNFPGARPCRPLAALALAQPQRASAAAVLAGVRYFTLRAFSRVPGINSDNHSANPSGC